MKRVVWIVSVLLIGGCEATLEPAALLPIPTDGSMRWADVGRACTPSAPATSLSPFSRDSLPPIDPRYRSFDDVVADIAKRVPGGWAGYYLREGVPVVVLVDTTRLADARAALQREGLSIPAHAIAQKARWNFTQLNDWSRYLMPKVQSVGGVSFSDIQETENRIELGVIDESAWRRVEHALQRVDTPCHLVAISISGYASPR